MHSVCCHPSLATAWVRSPTSLTGLTICHHLPTVRPDSSLAPAKWFFFSHNSQRVVQNAAQLLMSSCYTQGEGHRLQEGRKCLSWPGHCLPLQHHLLPIVFHTLHASHISVFPESLLPLGLCIYHPTAWNALPFLLPHSSLILRIPSSIVSFKKPAQTSQSRSYVLVAPAFAYHSTYSNGSQLFACLSTCHISPYGLWRQRPYLLTFVFPESSPVMDWE